MLGMCLFLSLCREVNNYYKDDFKQSYVMVVVMLLCGGSVYALCLNVRHLTVKQNAYQELLPPPIYDGFNAP